MDKNKVNPWMISTLLLALVVGYLAGSNTQEATADTPKYQYQISENNRVLYRINEANGVVDYTCIGTDGPDFFETIRAWGSGWRDALKNVLGSVELEKPVWRTGPFFDPNKMYKTEKTVK